MISSPVDGLEAIIRTLAEEVRTLRREVRHLMLFAECTARGQIGPDHDLTDQTIRFQPRGWKGKTYKGGLMSRAEPEFLFEYARALASMAADDKARGVLFNGKPQWIYGATDAGRARRWAYRLQTGWQPPAPPTGLRNASTFASMRNFAVDAPDEPPRDVAPKDEEPQEINFDAPFG